MNKHPTSGIFRNYKPQQADKKLGYGLLSLVPGNELLTPPDRERFVIAADGQAVFKGFGIFNELESAKQHFFCQVPGFLQKLRIIASDPYRHPVGDERKPEWKRIL